MDKKLNCIRQSSSRNLASNDSNRSSDITTKPRPRYDRRHETINQTNIKSNPQRFADNVSAKVKPNLNKRPKPRSGVLNLGSVSSGLELQEQAVSSTALDDPFSEDNIDLQPTPFPAADGRKQNLNHLLNFNYGRPLKDFGTNSSVSHLGNRCGLKKPKYSKEQFLQANCQFVISIAVDVEANVTSPDTLIDWSLIEQINMQTTEEPQCPICLYPPVATKLTRCGHAFCWPCILHYLALSDKSWRHCPICYDIIHPSDLRTAVILRQFSYNVGDFISLQLMFRKQDSLIIAKSGEVNGRFDFPRFSDVSDKSFFSKFVLADREEILSIIEREHTELCIGITDEPEFVFVQQALNVLQERKAHVIANIPNSETVGKRMENHKRCNSNEIAKLILVNSEKLEKVFIDSVKDEGKSYYFYQSVDGQNIYLHALNVKMLQKAYGSLNESPSTLRGKILQKDNYSMSEESRKRLRYLQHLPLTCQFEIVELELEPQIVSLEVLNLFTDDIQIRHRNRLFRQRRELKRERKINEFNERQMGKLPSTSTNINLLSHNDFPDCGLDDITRDSSMGDLSVDAAENSYLLSSSTASANGVSFAKMLLSSSEAAPERTTSINNDFLGLKLNSSTLDSEVVYTSNGEQILESRQTFGDALAEALEHSVTKKFSKNSRKEKKHKKMLLFSTGINFSG